MKVKISVPKVVNIFQEDSMNRRGREQDVSLVGIYESRAYKPPFFQQPAGCAFGLYKEVG